MNFDMPQARMGDAKGPTAVDLLDALPSARNDPQEAMNLVRQIMDRYGTEEHFFQAAAAELKVKPEDIKEVLMNIAKEPTQDPAKSASQGNFDQQTLPQINSQQDVENATPAQPVKGQPMQPVPPVMNMNNKMQPPPQLNGPAVNQQQGQLQAGGMAPAQAMVQASQQPQAQMGFKDGGQVSKFPKYQYNEELDGPLSKLQDDSKISPSFFDKIVMAIKGTPAGKALSGGADDMMKNNPQYKEYLKNNPKVAHVLDNPDILNNIPDAVWQKAFANIAKMPKGYMAEPLPGVSGMKVMQNKPNLQKGGFFDRDVPESITPGTNPNEKDFASGGVVKDQYEPNQQGPNISYSNGGMANANDSDTNVPPDDDNTSGVPMKDGGLPATSPEEQADDIDAKLSENEFVIPAYAVKYWGLAHLNSMLREAREEMGEMEEDGEVSEDMPPTKDGMKDKFACGGMVADTNQQNGNAPTIGDGNRYNKGGKVNKMKAGGFLANMKSLQSGTPKIATPDKPYKASSYSKLTRAPRQSRTFSLTKKGTFKPVGKAAYNKERLPDIFS